VSFRPLVIPSTHLRAVGLLIVRQLPLASTMGLKGEMELDPVKEGVLADGPSMGGPPSE